MQSSLCLFAHGVLCVAAYGLTWRNTSTWCQANKDATTLEHDLKLAVPEDCNQDKCLPQIYYAWTAGVVKVSADYAFSICGCKQTIWKGSRRGQHYRIYNAHLPDCPSSATPLDVGYTAGLIWHLQASCEDSQL